MDLSPALTDPELGFCAFTVLRTSYRLASGASVPSGETLPASGCVHPGAPETLQPHPGEDRREEYIDVFTDFALSPGENGGGAEYTAPDRILWGGKTWRVVKVRPWTAFGYVHATAVKTHE